MTLDFNFKECIFCHRAVPLTPIEILKDYMYVYFCHPCQAEYCTLSITNTELSYHIYTMINNKMYRLSHHYNSDRVQIWFIGLPGIPGKLENRELSLILTLSKDILPEITPDNVNEKLRTYIVFS